MGSNGLLVGRLSGSLKLGSLCNIQTLTITLLFHLRLVVLCRRDRGGREGGDADESLALQGRKMVVGKISLVLQFLGMASAQFF